MSNKRRKTLDAVLVSGYHVAGSALNLGLTISVGATANGAEFGYFSLALAAYVFSSGVWRSIGSEAALVTFSNTRLPSADQIRSIRVNAWRAGSVTCGVLLLLAAIVPGVRSSAIALLVPTMALARADAEQAILLGSGRPKTVTLIAAIPAAIMIAVAGLVVFGVAEPSVLVVASILGASSILSTWIAKWFVSGIQPERHLKPSATAQATPTNGVKIAVAGRALLIEYLVMAGSIQLTGYVVAGLVSITEAGAYRGTILATSPLTTLLVGIRHLVVVRLRENASPARLDSIRRSVWQVTLGVAIVTGALTLTVFQLGHLLLGESWDGTSAALLPMAVAVVLSTPMTLCSAVLRATQQFQILIPLRLVQAPMAIVASVLGALLGGAGGASAGLACTFALLTPAWMVFTFRSDLTK